jgi:hypothetical protein
MNQHAKMVRDEIRGRRHWGVGDGDCHCRMHELTDTGVGKRSDEWNSTAKGSKQNRGDGDPHRKVLGRRRLWSRARDGGRGLPRVDWWCELAKWMCHEILKLPVGTSWSKDLSHGGLANGGMEVMFWLSSTKLEITERLFIGIFVRDSPKHVGLYLQADHDSNRFWFGEDFVGDKIRLCLGSSVLDPRLKMMSVVGSCWASAGETLGRVGCAKCKLG